MHSESIAKPSARQAANQLWADSKGVMDSLKDLVNKGQAAEWCLTAVIVLLLALATDLQHSARCEQAAVHLLCASFLVASTDWQT